MKIVTPCILGLACLLAGNLNAQTSSVRDKIEPATSITVVGQESNAHVSSQNISTQEMIDPSVPSSFQFLIKDCQLKDGNYYLPQSRFKELTLQQQDYLLNNKTKFVIETK